jgi:ElaB/YqjD/DUF883 family membrane-anchored ribosome-binding protein
MEVTRDELGDMSGADSRNAAGDRSVTDRLAARAHEAVDRAAERSGAAEHEIREQAKRASEQWRRSEARVREAAGERARQLETFIERNPLLGAGIAFVAGLALSALLRR